jgi:hypothetical protein
VPSAVRPSWLLALVLSVTGAPRALADAADDAPARAEPRSLAESLEGEAKREYELARLLYDSGDYAGALTRFEHARKAARDPRLLWNEALCHKALHHYARASRAMRAYLTSGSPLISPAAASSAQSFLLAAERLSARIVVSANVTGVRVYADGESLGESPLGPDARVDLGTHQILVTKPDFTDYEQTVSVESSADVRVAAVLRPVVHEGRIVVRASDGAAIAIDGKVRGWGTWEGVLPSGRHALRISAPGFRPQAQSIVVTDAQTRGFDVTLSPAPRSGVPTWLWAAGGAALAAGAATAGYFIFRPGEPRKPTDGTIATVRLDLR